MYFVQITLRIYYMNTNIAFLARITFFVVLGGFGNESGVKPPHSIYRPINAICYRYNTQLRESWQEKKGKIRENEKKSLKKGEKSLKKDESPPLKEIKKIV